MSNTVLKRGEAVKKTAFIVFFVIIMMIAAFNVNAAKIYYNDEYHDYYAGDIHLTVNGKQIENLPMKPVVINDYTMVPVREVFEALGCEVIWHDDTCRVEIKNNGISIFVKIGDRNTVINDEIVPISQPQPLPMLIGNSPEVLKSMVPIRFVAEKLGYDVSWEDSSRTVFVSAPKSSEDEVIIGGSDGENNTKPDEENKDDETVIPEKEGEFGTISVESDDTFDYIYIATRYGISPTVTRYTNPERIVFDFENAAFPQMGGTVETDGNCVDSVRYANREGFARVVLDVSCKTQAMILSHEKGILIRVQKSDNTQLIYDAFKQQVYFDKAYVGSGKKVDNGYSVTFTSLKLQNQKIKIDDGIIYEIIITNSQLGCNITVDGSNKLFYTAEKGFHKTDNPVADDKPTIDKDGKKLIVIDAGHGGTDPGAVGYDRNGKAVAYESHINLAIALMVGEKLEANGVKVIYTRNTDTYLSLTERAELANTSECDFFVSIHCNSIESGDVNGTQVYYHPASETGTALAESIYDNIVDMTKLAPKKTQNGSHLYVIRTTTSPAVLVETAFISNESDRNFLMSKDGQAKLAEAIVKGILETIN